MPRRRTVRRFRSGDYRYYGNDLTRLNRPEQPETLKWASCAVRESIKLPWNRPTPGRAGGIYIGHSFEIVTAVFASFVFAPLAVGGLVTGYASTGVGAVAQVVTTGASGNAGLFLTGLLSTLGAANPYIQGPAYTNFSKPCDENAGKY